MPGKGGSGSLPCTCSGAVGSAAGADRAASLFAGRQLGCTLWGTATGGCATVAALTAAAATTALYRRGGGTATLGSIGSCENRIDSIAFQMLAHAVQWFPGAKGKWMEGEIRLMQF